MIDPVREFKIRAEILHHAMQTADRDAALRLRALDEFHSVETAVLRQAAPTVQRKHCLAIVAREAGFATWDHARRVLEGETSVSDFGTLLYGGDAGSRLHPWFNAYEEARAQLHSEGRGDLHSKEDREGRRYLLAYKTHFFIANPSFIKEALGCDPLDADWEAIGWDWPRPANSDARRRLYGKLLAAQKQIVTRTHAGATTARKQVRP